MTDFVISKYKEDISWVSDIKKSNLFIYNKNEEENSYIKLPNIGREAHTYLYHIVNNYENLSDYTCFLQGNPYEKFKGNLNCDIKSIENWNSVGFNSLFYILFCDLSGHPHHVGLEVDKIIFDKYFINKPNILEFSVGALFIVDKESILNRKKEFYEKLILEFYREDIDNMYTQGGGGTPGNKMPWVMERVWKYIFDSKYKTNFDR